MIRIAGDTATACAGLDMDRISFTVVLQTAGDLLTTANGIVPTGPTTLIGAIGQAALRALLPAWRRPRVKARTRKNPTSKYGPNAGQHPSTAQPYTFQAKVTFLEEGLAPRPRR